MTAMQWRPDFGKTVIRVAVQGRQRATVLLLTLEVIVCAHLTTPFRREAEGLKHRVVAQPPVCFAG
jgi:hypothetical protein